MYKLIFFVPVDQAEQVKQAVFAAGAGRLGHYQHCSFEVAGTGQFFATNQANPRLGNQEELTRVPELRVEVLCPIEARQAVKEALCQAHPYEQPAYEWHLIEIDN